MCCGPVEAFDKPEQLAVQAVCLSSDEEVAAPFDRSTQPLPPQFPLSGTCLAQEQQRTGRLLCMADSREECLRAAGDGDMFGGRGQ